MLLFKQSINLYQAIALLVCLFILEVFYFYIAKRFNIVDEPNHRSSHTKVTVRGGGIIFVFALLITAAISGVKYPVFITALTLISFISFVDDIVSLKSSIRLIIHFIASVLLVWQLNLIQLPIYYILLVVLFVIGCVNAVNFMDGINGLTGLYALVTLVSLYYLNNVFGFTDSLYLIAGILALLVFNYFNFRKKAICFSGDVGSVSIAFIIAFFLLSLVIYTHNINYLFFLFIYIADTATTIIFRLIRRENISQAHRTHLYQFLANEKRIGHLYVATIYAITQLIINIAVIKKPIFTNAGFFIAFGVFLVIFVLLRLSLEGKKRLISSSN